MAGAGSAVPFTIFRGEAGTNALFPRHRSLGTGHRGEDWFFGDHSQPC